MENHRFAHLPKTPVEIDGVTHHLCGDFTALAEAEAFFNLTAGCDINLAHAIFNSRDAASGLKMLRQLAPCALHTFQPSLSYESVQRMIDRSVASDNPAFVKDILRMWPAQTEDQFAANAHLCFDLGALAEANEFFKGKVGLTIICLDGPFTLDHVVRVFPCAVHRFRPELGLREARALMTVHSVRIVAAGLELAWGAASQESKARFAERLVAVASDEERQEFTFRVLAKRPWPGVAQA